MVVMADDGMAFDGTTPEHAPLGGAEAAFVALAEGFAARGHRVLVRNRCAAPVRHNGVDWAPPGEGLPARADLFIANRGHRLIGAMPARARRLLAAQSRPLSAQAALSLGTGAPSPGDRHYRHLSRGHRAVVDAERRARRHSLWHGRAVPGAAPAARTPAAARDLHLEPAARIGLAARSLGAAHSSRPARGGAASLLRPRGLWRAGAAKSAPMAAVLARADALGDKGVRRHAPLPRRRS